MVMKSISEYFALFGSRRVIITAVMIWVRGGVVCVQLCPTGNFDSQLRHILHKRILSKQDHADTISRVLDDVQATLSKQWQGFKIFPFGSLSTGLGTMLSDVDLSVQLLNYNSSAELQVVAEIEKLFMEQPEIYTEASFKIRPTFTRFSFLHIPLQRHVDLVLKGTEGQDQIAKLIRYYFNIDERAMPLACFLKIWFEVHILSGKWWLPNYTVYLLIIFYLQQKNMAPPGYVLQKDSVSYFVDDWDMGFNELPFRSTNTDNVYQLLGGFFKYYSEFNFEEYIVSPFAGRPIPKNAFEDVENFPDEFSLYKDESKYMLRLRIKQYLNTRAHVCIQDIFIHHFNKGDSLKHEGGKNFIYLITSAARMFEDLPSDRFLRAILITGQHKESVISHRNAAANEINERDCIEVPET